MPGTGGSSSRASVPPLVFGVAFGNLLLGVPFHFDRTMQRSFYTGSFFGAAESVRAARGAGERRDADDARRGIYLQMRTEGAVHERAQGGPRGGRGSRSSCCLPPAGVWIATGIEGYRIVSMPPADSAFMPLAKTVERSAGAWLANYSKYQWMVVAPLRASVARRTRSLLSVRGRSMAALASCVLSVAGVVLTAGFSLFPFIMPSSAAIRQSSLTAWDAVSSHRTLQVMFWAVVIFLPVIIVYTAGSTA